jgi:hypothetical protein
MLDEGYRVAEVAKAIPCTEQTVRLIRSKADRRPLEPWIGEQRKRRQVRMLDSVLTEAWDGWRASKGSDEPGDPRFLAEVRAALTDQRKVIGISEHAPKSDGDSTPAEFAQAVGAALRRLGQPPAPDPVEPGTVQ